MIEPGSKLAHYEVVSALGKGGMGEVWRAKDTKLGREVAIKTLPAEFAQDADRLARFEREAKLLASLNHPNIAAIYGLEEDSGTRFLVLELVEGDTLADRLARGAIRAEESLKLALQIAEALEAAHRKGVIHRDLKPANVKITPEGTVKVLDFGLAKAFEGDAGGANLSNSPTLSMAATKQGMILGTAAYMSPEQAGGEATDKRADIWAFGVVLFELLTGSQPFTGKNVSHIMASVINTDPDWITLPANLHPRLRMLLERCLQKDIADRYHDIADARVDVQAALTDPSGLHAVPSSKKGNAVSPVVLAAAVVIALGLGWFGATRLSAPIDTRPWVDGMVHFTFGPPAGTVFDTSFNRPLELSHDGSALAFVAVEPDGTEYLWIRELESENMRRLDGTEGARAPFWRPDGEEIGFYTLDALKSVPVAGGEPTTIIRIEPVSGNTGAWSQDGTILFWPGRFEAPMQRISSGGGTASQLDFGSDRGWPRSPVFLEEGNRFITKGNLPNPGVHIVSLDGNVDQFIEGRVQGQLGYSPGFLFYLLDGALVAHAFDEDDAVLIGEARRLVEGIPESGAGRTPYSVSRNGVLAFQRNSPGLDTILTWVDRDGNRIEDAVAEPRRYRGLDLSPDGTRLAYSLVDAAGGADVWVRDMVRGVEDPWTTHGDTFGAAWSRDGSTLAFMGGPDVHLVRENQDDSLELDSGASESIGAYRGADLGPEGDIIVYGIQYQDASSDLGILSLETGDSELLPISTEEWNEGFAKLSPDGNWLAYTTDRSGASELFVARFPSGEDQERISITGGRSPRWRPDGNELFFVSRTNDLMAVQLDLTATPVRTSDPIALFNLDETARLLTGITRSDTFVGSYAVSPDGDRFLVPVIADTPQPPIHIMINWPALLGE